MPQTCRSYRCDERLRRQVFSLSSLPLSNSHARPLVNLVSQENCPACFEEPKERYRVKTLLAQQEHLFPNLMGVLINTMRPLMQDHSFDACIGKAAPILEVGEREHCSECWTYVYITKVLILMRCASSASSSS
jgi:hypothetical protein